MKCPACHSSVTQLRINLEKCDNIDCGAYITSISYKNYLTYNNEFYKIETMLNTNNTHISILIDASWKEIASLENFPFNKTNQYHILNKITKLLAFS